MSEDAVAPRRSRSWGFAALAVVVLVAGIVSDVLAWEGYLLDDSYIYLRYAWNNIQGCWFEWNCGGGRVEGFTSPLYLLLLTAVGGVGVDLESASTLVGVATWFTALIGFVLLPLHAIEDRATASIVSLFVACCFIGDEYLAINIVSGMEGGLVCLALLAISYLAFQPARLALVVPWMTLVRPELGLATLFQPALGLEHWRRAAMGAVAGFGVICLVRLAVFGSLMPNIFWAKRGGSVLHFSSGISYIADCVSTFPAFLLIILGLFSSRRALRYLAGLGLAWVLYFAWSGGDFYLHARLFVFLLPMAYFVGISAAFELLGDVEQRTRVALVAALLLASVLLGHHLREPRKHGTHVATWALLGKWLNRCMPGESVATVPIGAIGYHSRSPVVDLAGLVDPVVARDGSHSRDERFSVGHTRAHPAHSLAQEPGVILFGERGTAPFDGSTPLVLSYPEHELFQHMKATSAPYTDVSLPLPDGEYQLMFVRNDLAALPRTDACKTGPMPK